MVDVSRWLAQSYLQTGAGLQNLITYTIKVEQMWGSAVHALLQKGVMTVHWQLWCQGCSLDLARFIVACVAGTSRPQQSPP